MLFSSMVFAPTPASARTVDFTGEPIQVVNDDTVVNVNGFDIVKNVAVRKNDAYKSYRFAKYLVLHISVKNESDYERYFSLYSDVKVQSGPSSQNSVYFDKSEKTSDKNLKKKLAAVAPNLITQSPDIPANSTKDMDILYTVNPVDTIKVLVDKDTGESLKIVLHHADSADGVFTR